MQENRFPRNPWKNERIHRILVFCEHGMTKQLVNEFFQEFSKSRGNLVLDPFVGSGTVAVEAKKRGIDCVGIDSNPWSLLVTKSKVDKPRLDKKEFLEAYSNIDDYKMLIPSERLKNYHSPTQLEALGKIRSLINDFKNDSLLLTILAKVAEKYSRLRKSPAPRYRKIVCKSSKHKIFEEFKELFLQAYSDLECYGNDGNIDLVLADSSVWLPKAFDGILTSPPFANNIDYIRHTQLHILWAGLAKDSKDLGMLRSLQIPACEASARKWKKKTERKWILDKIFEIRSDRKYHVFLSQYFYYMERHLELVSERLAWEAWYTIGDSIFKGTYIPTHEFLKRIAEDFGLKAELRLLGLRGKGKGLYLIRLRAKR